ncbi:MAG: hypothetical protein ACLQVI_39185 [Polyangiaceae bacterium]
MNEFGNECGARANQLGESRSPGVDAAVERILSGPANYLAEEKKEPASAFMIHVKGVESALMTIDPEDPIHPRVVSQTRWAWKDSIEVVAPVLNAVLYRDPSVLLRPADEIFLEFKALPHLRPERPTVGLLQMVSETRCRPLSDPVDIHPPGKSRSQVLGSELEIVPKPRKQGRTESGNGSRVGVQRWRIRGREDPIGCEVIEQRRCSRMLRSVKFEEFREVRDGQPLSIGRVGERVESLERAGPCSMEATGTKAGDVAPVPNDADPVVLDQRVVGDFDARVRGAECLDGRPDLVERIGWVVFNFLKGAEKERLPAPRSHITNRVFCLECFARSRHQRRQCALEASAGFAHVATA